MTIFTKKSEQLSTHVQCILHNCVNMNPQYIIYLNVANPIIIDKNSFLNMCLIPSEGQDIKMNVDEMIALKNKKIKITFYQM